ncbi:MAG: hypothetical protein BGO89_12450 [Candidatus Kapaibacterium thiocyanatum]|uniref:Uncharacterized protein n=1 Tax=Candidatus Kapaibacterium thiocyanatum TaxID=1895771 RepID=A0A1M3KYI2_9BACT|nr:MAG: hypothetical protein BGO89_12450 ['Candidatus Kapabacteria' thiocyanatum]
MSNFTVMNRSLAILLCLVLSSAAIVAQGIPQSLAQARKAAATRNWKDVRKHVSVVLKKNPAMPEALMLLGMAELESGAPLAALDAVQRVIASNPGIMSAYLFSAECRQRLKQPDSAVAVLRTAARLFPDSLQPDYALGMLYFRAARYDDALTPLETVVFKRPDFLPAIRQLAVCYAKLDRLQEASDLLGRVLEESPADVQTRIWLAETQLGLKHYDSTAALYETAVKDRPNDADAWYNYGIARQNLGQVDSAIKYFRRAIAIRPSFPEAYFNLAISYQQRGFDEEAVQAFRRAALQRPSLAADSYNSIAVIYRGQGRFDEAMEAHQQSIALNDTNALYRASVGNTYFAASKFEEGRRYLEEALRKFPDDTELLFTLARHYIRLGDLDKAKAIESDLDKRAPELSAQLRGMQK